MPKSHSSNFPSKSTMTDITPLTEMGFTAQQAMQALEASGNDMQKAIAFLVDGVVQDLVEITNKEDIPDLDLVRVNRDVSESPPSITASHGYSMEHLENSKDSNEYEMVPSSPDSIIMPEIIPKEDDEPAVLITPTLNRCNRLAGVFIRVLSQIDQFTNRISNAKNNKFLQQLNSIVQNLNTSGDNYVLNQLNIPLQPGDDSQNEYVQAILNAFEELYSDEFDDDYMRKLLKSTVCVEDEGEEDVQDICVIEIETEHRFPNVHTTLNDLFWGTEYSQLGKIWLQEIGTLVCLSYASELTYWRFPLELSEEIYPGLYSKEATLEFLKLHKQNEGLSKQKAELSNKALNLLVFQGKKISSFLQQAQNFLEDQDAKTELKQVTESLQQQKIEVQQALDKLAEESDQFDISNTDRFIEGRDPYILVAVTLTESEYFFLHKESKSWMYVYVQDDMTFTQDFADFNSVNHLLHDRLRTSLTDFNVVYCDKKAFYETSQDISEESHPITEDDKLVDL